MQTIKDLIQNDEKFFIRIYEKNITKWFTYEK